MFRAIFNKIKQGLAKTRSLFSSVAEFRQAGCGNMVSSGWSFSSSPWFPRWMKAGTSASASTAQSGSQFS